MPVALHLMDTRKIIHTEIVEGAYVDVFRKVMDSLILHIDEYVGDSIDGLDGIKSYMKDAAMYYRDNPLSIDDTSSFNTGDPISPQPAYTIAVQTAI